MSEAAIEALQEKASRGARMRRAMQRWRLPLMIGGPLAILLALGALIYFSGRTEGTDNAYVEAARVPISASINSRIIEMRVRDNESVRKGQTLFVLDQANYDADVAQWEAAVANAEARVRTLKAEYQARQAELRAAQLTLRFAQRERARTQRLLREGVASARDADAAAQAEANADMGVATARQALASALAALGGDPAVPVAQHALVREAAARLERARLALSYVTVPSPQDGVVTRVDQVQVGTFVSPGQPLFYLVAGEPWIEANFKESQLTHMRVGQRARVRIDSYPGEPLEARVASFSPGTGAVFATIPAQNASGNWVKVVQRLPVRLTLVNPPADLALRAGLSARVTVDVHSPPDTLRGRD
ncbi:MAG: HlyD family secretion protein [Hyphomonadaceae bacterium]